jgi:hypothetical protein
MPMFLGKNVCKGKAPPQQNYNVRRIPHNLLHPFCPGDQARGPRPQKGTSNSRVKPHRISWTQSLMRTALPWHSESQIALEGLPEMVSHPGTKDKHNSKTKTTRLPSPPPTCGGRTGLSQTSTNGLAVTLAHARS